MKQILQSLKTGATEVAELPAPRVQRGQLLIETTRTLVSAGTERMLVEFGKAGWFEKARQQPDKVAMVIRKLRTDGLLPTIEAVLNKLDQPLPLGYCNVGIVRGVGAGVTGFVAGDRVASNGKHAEVVSVPVNLCARVPDIVADDLAAFTVVGAIALQGIRLAKPTLGEIVVVTGLGLIGLMAVQLLKAHGCRVLGLDFDPQKLELARRFGAEVIDLASGEDPIRAAQLLSRERGVDAVIITAATKSNEPVHQAAQMCRKRGSIVLVGVTGLELSRDDFYKKELTFQVSASYGPGRYDPSYEEGGHDYPVGFVRWTAQRNFEAVLDMMADGRLEVAPLISHRFAIGEAERAYHLLAGEEPSLGIVLDYPRLDPVSALQTIELKPDRPALETPAAAAPLSVGFIGAGNYATAMLIPAFKAAGARLRTVASNNGVSALHAARKFGIAAATTDTDGILRDPEVDAVVISTRHDSHPALVSSALRAGKHVFVEKPLAIDIAGLHEIETAYQTALDSGFKPLVMVGFNRRFAPHVRQMKELLDHVTGPKSFIVTVNAGAIPADHWTHDVQIGGGRIIGEACHFVDLLRFLAGAPVKRHAMSAMQSATQDTVGISLEFEDGSIGSIHYLANGSSRFPKERVEVFCAGKILQLDNFRQLRGYGWTRFSKMKLWRQDKGQHSCARAFVDALRAGGPAPIPVEQLFEVARVTIALAGADLC